MIEGAEAAPGWRLGDGGTAGGGSIAKALAKVGVYGACKYVVIYRYSKEGLVIGQKVQTNRRRPLFYSDND